MKVFNPFTVKIPASTANLGPGFDSIGMALNRYLKLTFSPHSALKITVSGEDNELLPLDESNLILQVIDHSFATMGQKRPPFHLHIDNDIPLARGLGSSASAIVGALIASNQLLDNVWDQNKLFQMATKWEEHPDNVGASLFGGVVIGSWDGQKAHLVQAEPPPFDILVAIPQQTLFTKKARGVLPEVYQRKEAILTSSRANLLVAAIIQKQWDLLPIAMEDWFHHPYRQQLVPGLSQALQEANQYGAKGVALSGAGPTLLAFTQDVKRLHDYFTELFARMLIPVEIRSLQAVKNGALVQLTELEEYSTFG